MNEPKIIVYCKNCKINLSQVCYIEELTENINTTKVPILRFWFSETFYKDWVFETEKEREKILNTTIC